MGIALLTFSSLFQGLSALHRTASPPVRAVNRTAVFNKSRGIRMHSPFHRAASASTLPSSPTRSLGNTPLRVVRMSEGGERPGSAGRMVISGRMADVCAELDRLVAREAAAAGH